MRHIVPGGEGMELLHVAVMTECVGPPSHVLRKVSQELFRKTDRGGKVWFLFEGQYVIHAIAF